jgi:deoxyadenosine/deoxycytidine kinase
LATTDSSVGNRLEGVSYLGIEGVIGVGKTTLAKAVAAATGARLVLEEVEENPFLERFYEDPRRFAFQTQVFFLLSRYRQQEFLRQGDLFATSIVTDYIFAKDRVFAYLNLDDRELALYERLATVLEASIPTPDAVIYLQAGTDVLMERVAKRGRPYERHITSDYLTRLNESYNHFFFHYQASPLLVVDANHVNFTTDARELQALLEQVKGLGPGTSYYAPRMGRDGVL